MVWTRVVFEISGLLSRKVRIELEKDVADQLLAPRRVDGFQGEVAAELFVCDINRAQDVEDSCHGRELALVDADGRLIVGLLQFIRVETADHVVPE